MEDLFAAFGLASQALLLAFFAARRWTPTIAGRYGWIAYGLGAVGLALGCLLLVGGASWRLYSGPFIYAVWSAFGAWADVRRGDWRRPPIVWGVLVPYLTLYLAAQMFLWWPLWNFWRSGWFLYLILFIANTASNITGHFDPAAKPSRRAEA